jgi:molybdate transport repressor ModE-like protein
MPNLAGYGEWEDESEIIAAPNIRHLRVLESVARNGSIGKAALEFGLSQPAVSQAIAKIEKNFGRAVLDRTQGGSFLTTGGDVFLHRVRRFLDQVDRAVNDIDPLKNGSIARHISSTQIRALLAIGFSSSFSEAARSLGISAPALQRVARDLETIANVPLYQTTKLGLSLNQTGSDLARRLGLAVKEITSARDDLSYLDGIEAGSVVIGTLPMSGDYLIGAAIAELTAAFPGTRVRIMSSPYSVLLDRLRTGRIDFIFGALRHAHSDYELHEEALFSDPYCIVGRAGHPLDGKRSISAEDLLAYEWIAPGQGSARRKQFEALFDGVEAGPRSGIETSSISTIRSILTCSDRLALVNKHEVELESRIAVLKLIQASPGNPAMAKGITARADWLPTPIQFRLLSIIRTNARLLEQDL